MAKRRMSPAARKRISERMKALWAERKGSTTVERSKHEVQLTIYANNSENGGAEKSTEKFENMNAAIPSILDAIYSSEVIYEIRLELVP